MIARIIINNLRYADDTTLMAESEEKLKSLLMKVKEESEKASLKPNIKKKIKIMVSGIWFHHFMGNKKHRRYLLSTHECAVLTQSWIMINNSEFPFMAVC